MTKSSGVAAARLTQKLKLAQLNESDSLSQLGTREAMISSGRAVGGSLNRLPAASFDNRRKSGSLDPLSR